MPLDSAFKIIFNIHLSTLSLPSRSLCLLHNTSNFLPFLFLARKDLFNLHCPKLSSSCRYRGREEFSAICHHSKIGFWGWVFFLGSTGECRWGSFLIYLQLIRRQPKAHVGGLRLPVHQPGTGGWCTGFQSCLLPQKWHMPEKNLTWWWWTLFCGPCNSEKWESDCLMSTSWHTPSQPGWPHSSLDMKVKQQSLCLKQLQRVEHCWTEAESLAATMACFTGPTAAGTWQTATREPKYQGHNCICCRKQYFWQCWISSAFDLLQLQSLLACITICSNKKGKEYHLTEQLQWKQQQSCDLFLICKTCLQCLFLLLLLTIPFSNGW